MGLRDLHSVAGTWTLPHAFVLAFTGAYLSFTIAVALPMLAKIAFKGDVREMVTTLNGLRAVDPRPAAICQSRPDARGCAQARRCTASDCQLGKSWSCQFSHHDLPAPRSGELTAMRLIYNGATGELIRERPIVGMKPSLGASLLGLIGPVHFGNFAGWWCSAASGSRSARRALTWPGVDWPFGSDDVPINADGAGSAA